MRKIGWAFFPIFLLFFSLVPYLKNGFWSDDLINSSVFGTCLLKSQTLLSFWGDGIRSWFYSGRIFPLATIVVSTGFYYLKETEWFRIYQVTLVFTNFILFYKIVYQLTKSRFFSTLCLLMPSLLFQIITYQDPIASFGALLQWVTLFIFATLLFFLKYRETGRKVFLFLSLFFWGTSLLTYEVSVVAFFSVAGLLLVSTDSWTKKIKEIAPYVGILVAYLTLALLMRRSSPNVHDGISLGNVLLVVPTFFKQLSGSVPFSYFIFSPRSYSYEFFGEKFLLLGKIKQLLKDAFFVVPLLCIFAGLFQLFKENPPQESLPKKSILVLAGVFLFLPAFLISISLKYQMQVGWGSAYLPVYLQYFGMALVLALLLWKQTQKVSRPFKLALLALLLTLSIGFNRARNEQIVTAMDMKGRFARDYLHDLLKIEALKNSQPPFLLVTRHFGFSGFNLDFIKTHFPELPNNTLLLDQEEYLKDPTKYDGRNTWFLEARGNQTGITFELGKPGKENEVWQFWNGLQAKPDGATKIPVSWLRDLYQNPYQPIWYQKIR